MTTLVSVLMPVFNCVQTLPFALTSLQAQTHDEWECILVDDGSTDRPDAIIKELRDPRINYCRLEQNRGRGFARQRALDMAKGKYIAFLDADDWIYPNKLRLQTQVLDENRGLAAVSSGMCISNVEGQLVGVRNTSVSGTVRFGTMRRPGMPPLAFAPCMLRAEIAKGTGFDTSFPIAEDADFLLRALLGKQYAVLSNPLYVYREQGAMTLSKVSSALNHCCRMFSKQLRAHPFRSTIEVAKARGKQVMYHAGAALGYWDQIIARRSRMPSGDEQQQYREAWTTVSAIASRHFVAACSR